MGDDRAGFLHSRQGSSSLTRIKIRVKQARHIFVVCVCVLCLFFSGLFLVFFCFVGFFGFFVVVGGFFWGRGVSVLFGLLFLLFVCVGCFFCGLFWGFLLCWFFIFFRGEVFQFRLVCCLFVWGWVFFCCVCVCVWGVGWWSGGCVGFCFYFYFLYIFLPDYRLHDFFIEVMQSRTETAPSLCHHQIPPLRSFAVFQCHRYIRGRYVRIRKQGPAEFFDVLALCEVEVKGYKIGRVTSYSSVRF